MLKATLKSLFAHKTRLALTALSIVLGVAFISGTFVFTDTTNKAFDGVFADAFAGVDIVVSADSDFAFGQGTYFDESMIDDIAGVAGVEQIEPSVQGFGVQITDDEGEGIGGNGPPQLGAYIPAGDAIGSGLVVREGRAPTVASEMAMDAGSAEAGDFGIGDMVTVLSPTTPATEFELVGIYGFGEQNNLGGATLALFDLETIQDLLGRQGEVDGAYILVDPSSDVDEVTAAIQQVLPEGAQAQPAQTAAEEQAAEIQEGLAFFGTFLLVFAFIALFVGTFIIYNTFRIVIAQRLRELALMRAIGSTRGQVVRTVLLEAAIVGFVSSVIGIVVGLGLAVGLRSALATAGIDLPAVGLVLTPRTVVVGVVVGVVVTLVSAVFPAILASRIPPVAAMREEAAPPRRRSLVRRAIVGTVITLLGVAALIGGLNGDLDAAAALPLVGAGAGVIIIGAYVLSALIARPVAAVVGWPFAKIFGSSGMLAQRNAGRSPRRTAATSAALMIGVALISLVSILSASIQSTVDEIFDTGVDAQVIVTPTDQISFTGFTPELGDRIATLPEVSDLTRLQNGAAIIDDVESFIVSIEPNAGDFFSYESLEGTLEMAADEVAIGTDIAEDLGVGLGDQVDLTFERTGAQSLTVAAVVDSETLGGYMLSREGYADNYSVVADGQIYVQLVEGVTPEEGRDAVQAVAEDVPTANVQTEDESIDAISDQINQILTLVTGLLGLTVVIALIGVLNTMSLAVYERTREIGLLRAVGLTRLQTRRMIRSEASIISTFGALLGVGLGIFFGWAVIQALSSEGFSSFTIPYLNLVFWVVLVTVLGIVAAILPARRASKLNVLDAISYE